MHASNMIHYHSLSTRICNIQEVIVINHPSNQKLLLQIPDALQTLCSLMSMRDAPESEYYEANTTFIHKVSS